ncbi:MAG: universal stress protein [Bacteroidetes bacterium]|nr:universal stress protein [Bacteroidota bacterium]MCL5025706.1 universal stress protein [Chloroflexota bacterium]
MSTGITGIEPLGAVLAVGFAASMATIFWWMFRVPPAVTYRAVTARRAVSALRKILVPTLADEVSARAVEMAARLAEPQQAEIILAYVFEVPLLLPLGARIPEMETRAEEAFTQAEGIVKAHGLQSRRRNRASRQAGDGIVDLAREEQADLIVMGLGHKHRPGDAIIGPTTERVLHRAPCEVLIDRALIGQ